MSFNILSVTDLTISELDHLVKEASTEQHSFMLRMKAQYIGNKNRFDKKGEAIFLALKNETIVGFVGLNIDPYLDDKNVGRVRHLYVQKDYRRQSIGQELMKQVIAKARDSFKILTLRTFDLDAAKFYETLGFVTTPLIYASSHNLSLNDENYLPESFITKIEKGLMVDGH